jgi:hypothetical protein
MDRALRWIPFRRRRPALDRKGALGAVPVRNSLIEWSRDDQGLVVLRVPWRRDWLGCFLKRLVSAPDVRSVVLDEVGSDVWELCDGEHSVDGIVRALAKKYRLNRREVELSLALYVLTLAKRGYVGLMAKKGGGP